MPLRDHFRPPVSKLSSWEGFHGLWLGVIVQELASRLTRGIDQPARAAGAVVGV